MEAFRVVWISAAAVVMSASLLVRVLVITRLLKRSAAPAWLTPALTAVMILAATCLLAAVTRPDIGR
jgi:hypothetical protein